MKTKPSGTDYFQGDKIKFTGNVDKEGFWEAVFVDGWRKGETIWRPSDTMKETQTALKIKEFKNQQEQFRRLHKGE